MSTLSSWIANHQAGSTFSFGGTIREMNSFSIMDSVALVPDSRRTHCPKSIGFVGYNVVKCRDLNLRMFTSGWNAISEQVLNPFGPSGPATKIA
jgi:hypothetical protein